MESKVRIFQTSAGGGRWAWMLYQRRPGEAEAWVMRACELGFPDARAAKMDFTEFVSAAASAVVSVTRKESPDEPAKRPAVVGAR